MTKVTEGICTGLGLAKLYGSPTFEAFIKKRCHKLGRRLETPYQDGVEGEAVVAFVDNARWSARCPDCNAQDYVTPEELIFYCFSCGNRETGGHPRPVIFPNDKERLNIEKILMARPVVVKVGINQFDRALNARPVARLPGGLGIGRSWTPDETIDDLVDQNKMIPRKYMEAK